MKIIQVLGSIADFGQGLNQMELFQETIARVGQVEIAQIMRHGVHFQIVILSG